MPRFSQRFCKSATWQTVVAAIILAASLADGDAVSGLLPYDKTSPVIHTNDGNIDVYTLEYLMSLASAGDIRLVGIIADFAKDGGPRSADEGNWQYQQIVEKARRSGMKEIPNSTPGAGRTLTKPASGRIEDTVPIDTPGSRLIVEEARKATPQTPLVIITGGGLTTVADAYLLDPSIADKVVVASLLGRFRVNLLERALGLRGNGATPVPGMRGAMDDYNGLLDVWASYIVLEKLRYVQFPFNIFYPHVPKERLAGPEIPDTELKRFMLDKDQGNGLPGPGDFDSEPAIGLMRSDYVTAAKRISFGGFRSEPDSKGVMRDVPLIKDDPNGKSLLITKASQGVATTEWWRALSNPAAYTESIVQQSPFRGIPTSIPGKIEAEDFDWGGKGVAFFTSHPTGWPIHRVDDSGSSSGNLPLDIAATEDTGGGWHLIARAGDWWKYTIEVPAAGSYDVEIRLACVEAGQLHLELDDVKRIESLDVPNPGGAWQTVTIPGIMLDAGRQVLRVCVDSGDLKLNAFTFKRAH